MKSTASAALASLKHKFQSKILEVGKLKRDMAKQGALYLQATDKRDSIIAAMQVQLDIAQMYSPTESVKLRARVADLISESRRHEVRANSAERLLKDAHGSTENWKSLAVVLCITGVILGGLSHYAYVLNVAV